MRYIICKALNRKNARRKELTRFYAKDNAGAIKHFEAYYWHNTDMLNDKKPYRLELLTGDWRHLAGYNLKNNNLKED